MALRICWIRPVGYPAFNATLAANFAQVKMPGTELEVLSLRNDAVQHHLEYHCYEALVASDLIKVVRDTAQRGFDAIVVGCFYDPFLTEAREISGDTVVIGPCHAALEVTASLANRFSIIAGRRKWHHRIACRVRDHGYSHALASIRSLDLGVEALHLDQAETQRRMIEQGRRAIDDDGAEALILGCTLEFGFYRELQSILNVPVIDSGLAAFKRAEAMADMRQRFGWRPSRIHSCEPPPEAAELLAWKVFDSTAVPIDTPVFA